MKATRDTAARYVEAIVHELRGPRKCAGPRPPELDESALTPEQRSNLQAKRRFVDRIHEVLGDEESIRDLALFFGVKRTKLHERMREKRTDLAPLDEWFKKLDDYADFKRLLREFSRRSA